MCDEIERAVASTPSAPCKANTCAVIVTFHPDPGFEQRLARIAGQVGQLVIVDNNSGQADVDRLQRLESQHGAELILNGENLGLATALNQGVLVASKNVRCEWVLFLDQDSDVAGDIVDVFESVFNAIDAKDCIGTIGGNYMEKTLKRARHAVLDGMHYREATVTITSGSIVSLFAYKVLGRFRDEFFIDHIDHEFCLRAKVNNLKVFITNKPVIHHSIGNDLKKNFFLNNVLSTNHSPIRRYYMTRNLVVLVREYWNKQPRWLLRMIIVQSILYVAMFFSEQRRLEKLNMIAIGFWHGLRGRMGQFGQPNT